jgi:SAM-dependent methyltransferase
MVIGMELFAEGLHYARQRTNCALVQGDMYASPFGVQFEVIGLFDVIEHLPNDRAVLDNLYNMLVPGGALLLTVPAFPALWSYFDEAAHHCRRYELAEMERKLSEAGYEVEYLSYFMATIFPLTWLNRRLATLLNKLFKGRSAPALNVDELTAKELRIVPLLNEGLGGLLSWEKQVIKRRNRLPFGTSLLAIARKRKIS